MGFQKAIVETVTSSETKKSSEPQLKIKNPLDKKIFINSILLNGGVNFLTRGKVVVTIGGVVIFEPSQDNSVFQFAERPSIPIPMNNQNFERGETIDIFVWNGSDSTPIMLTVEVQLSDEKGSVSTVGASTVSISQEDVRRRNSISQSLFAQANYSDQELTALVDMNGYTKMVLLISGSANPSPTVIIDDFAYTNPENAVDLDLTTETEGKFVSITKDFIIDFGTVASRIPKCELNIGGVTPTDNTYELAVSDDNGVLDPYVTVDSQNTINPSDVTLEGAEQSFRYLRFRFIHNSGNSIIVGIIEMYDAKTLGGNATLSFEVKDANSGQWIEILSGTDIGAITRGGAVSKQIGDVINDVSTNKFNAILPSTSTDFRAKLTVVGNINTGVSIVKVD